MRIGKMYLAKNLHTNAGVGNDYIYILLQKYIIVDPADAEIYLVVQVDNKIGIG
jgi:hypothetical protein